MIRIERTVHTSVNIILLLSLAWAGVQFIRYSNTGFDHTDEAFNLLLAAFPSAGTGRLMLTGDITSIIWQWVQQSIPDFRIAGFVILIASGLILGASTTLKLNQLGLIKSNDQRKFFVLTGIVLSCLFYYRGWNVPSPGYNLLATVGILLIFSGLILFETRITRTIPIFLVGFGGYIALCGKVTSAFAMLLVFAVMTLFAKREGKFHDFAYCVLVAGALTVIHLIFLTDGLEATVSKFRIGLEYVRLAGTNHTAGPERLFTEFLPPILRVFLFTQKITLLAMILLAVLVRKFDLQKWYFCTITLISVGEISTHDISFGNATFYTVTSFVATMAVATVVYRFIGRGSAGLNNFAMAARWIVLGFICVYAIVYGTNTGLARKMMIGAMFMTPGMFVFAALAEKYFEQKFFLAALSIVVAGVSLTFFDRSIMNPFRTGGPLPELASRAEFVGHSDFLRLEPGMAEYARDLKRAALENGWTSGTPLLNLTGAYPGSNIIMNAQYLSALPWLMGGDEGSVEAAEYALGLVEISTLQRAWIMTSPDSHNSIPEDVLSNRGLNFPREYKQIGSFSAPNFRGPSRGKLETHVLWKPMHGPLAN